MHIKFENFIEFLFSSNKNHGGEIHKAVIHGLTEAV